MSGRRLAAGGLCWLLSAAPAAALDLFDVESDIPPTSASPLLGDEACGEKTISQPLTLQDAVEHALCGSPKTREAWADIKVKAAAVGVARGAYLPTLSGTGQELRDATKSKISGRPDLSTSTLTSAYSASVSLSWVLYDFGGRSAALDNATELLAATQANHQASLQQVFATVAKDYYATQAAQGAVAAAIETERAAQSSFEVATQRVNKGASPISDSLQAQTAFIQARVNRTKAEGDWRSAIGVLAADMALRPDAAVALPDVETGLKPDAEFQQTVSALIDDAVQHHPSVRAAEAQLRAQEAAIRQAEAEGLPSVSLVGKSSHNDQPVSEGLGLRSLGATGTDNYIGVQVTVPLFEGFTRGYKIRQAEAQAEAQRYSLEDARQQVGLDVWTSYQLLQSATTNLTDSAMLLEIAQRSYTVAQGRYARGIGSMIELLNAQSALAGARKQRLQSLTDWRTSRLQLASKLGLLDMGQVEGE